MFAIIDLNERDLSIRVSNNAMRGDKAVFSFYAGPGPFAELVEQEGVIPAPYLARAFWVALTDWGAMRDEELRPLLKAAHLGILERMPRKARELLAAPKKPCKQKA